VAARRAERAAQADLAAALEHRDHHHVRDPDPADEQRDGAKPEQQRGQRVLGRGTCGERVGWAADGDLLRALRIGGRGE